MSDRERILRLQPRIRETFQPTTRGEGTYPDTLIPAQTILDGTDHTEATTDE